MGRLCSPAAMQREKSARFKPWKAFLYRTERALRFVLGAVVPLIVAFGYELPIAETHKPFLNLNFTYLLGVFYCIFAALAPPQLSSIPIVAGGGFAGILMGVVVATAAFAATVKGGDAAGFTVFLVGMFMCAPQRTGKYQALTNLTALCSIYGGTIAFIMMVHFGDSGIDVYVPTAQLVASMSSPFTVNTVKQVLPSSLYDASLTVYGQMMKDCTDAGGHLRPCNATHLEFKMPLGELEGTDVSVWMDTAGVRLKVERSLILLRVLWTSNGPMGVMRPLFLLFFISVGFFSLSLLLPLPRVRTSYNLARAELVRIMTGPLSRLLQLLDDIGIDSGGQREQASTEPQEQRLGEVQALADESEERAFYLSSIAKSAICEPSWPPMGIGLLQPLPAVVVAVRRCARACAAVARVRCTGDDVEVPRSSEVSALMCSVRAVIRAAAGQLAGMTHNGDDLTGVSGGHRQQLISALDDLREQSARLPANAAGWTLRHSVVAEALRIGSETEKIAALRSRGGDECRGSLAGVGSLLGGMLAPLIVPLYRLFESLVTLPRNIIESCRGGAGRFDLRIQLGITAGVALLVAPVLYIPGWRTWGRSAEVEVMVNLSGRFAIWSCLGFIVCFQPTMEGTLHKAVLRAIGSILGAVSAFLAVIIFGAENHGALIAWLLVSYAIAVWPTADPNNALLGFRRSWGYAGQLFTYTETILVIECAVGLGEPATILRSRLLGQLLGIAVAVLASLAVRVRAADVSRHHVAVSLGCCADALGDLGLEALAAPDAAARQAAADKRFASAEAALELAQVALDDAHYSVRHGVGRCAGRASELDDASDIVAEVRCAIDLLQAAPAPTVAAAAASAEESLRAASEWLLKSDGREYAGAGKAAEEAPCADILGSATLGLELPVDVSGEASWILKQVVRRARRMGHADGTPVTSVLV